MEKKKREKAEDFIGWKSEDGLLEVIGIHGKQGRKTVFKVICHKCKEDKELFPDGYFVSMKSSLIKGSKPCGCSKKPKWTKAQFLVLARRAAKDRFIVHGYSEEFHGQHTKVNLECLIDGYKWFNTVNSIMNYMGCHKCKGSKNGSVKRTEEQEALNKCKAICEAEDYELIGFVDGYRNALKSRFEYKCLKHGKQSVIYNNFVNNGSRCWDCWKERQKEIIRENGNGNGYYPDRKDEKDFLYVLDFDKEFLKVGRSFDVNDRMGNLKSVSKIKNIHKLRIFTGTHQEIYDLEQELHSELRERNFQYYVDWSNECFEKDCLHYLNMLLDKCGLEDIFQ